LYINFVNVDLGQHLLKIYFYINDLPVGGLWKPKHSRSITK